MKKLNQITLLLCAMLLLYSCEAENIVQPVDKVITLSAETLILSPGSSQTLVATVTPATSDALVWSSSDASIASVFYGVVTAQKAGTTQITATCGQLSATCTISVVLKDYQLVWSDEFNESTLNLNNWTIEVGGGGWGNQEKQYYTDRTDNLSFENGCLVLEAKKESYQSMAYTSARITSKNKQSFKYGKIEACLSLPSGGGTWPAFWMLGYGSWPTCGEIDIMEHTGNGPGWVSHAVHTRLKNGTNGRNWSQKVYKDNFENEFHVYGIEWEETYELGDDLIRFLIDGEVTATLWEPHNTDDFEQWPFNNNFYLIFNLAMGGNMGGTIDDTMFLNAVKMKVDWIRVYQRL